MRPEQTNPTIVGVIPRQATAVMQKETCIKKILQWSIVQKNILAKNMIQYIKRNVVHNIFFITFIIIADPFNESE